MEVIKYPSREEWASLALRPALDVTTLFDTVRTVLDEVRKGGDAAVIRYEEKFDKIDPATFKRLQVSEQELAEAKELVPEELKQAIRQAKNNIEIFHASQRFTGKKVETTPGVTCWQKAVAIEKVGLYIPGGTAPLFSTVLMLAVPARIAGCKEIVLCTPPGKDGKVHPAILFAAETAGVSKIFKAGGIQAIAAMAYGTESVPKVYKIFGPGNQYVTAAKQLVSLKEVAIDMPARSFRSGSDCRRIGQSRLYCRRFPFPGGTWSGQPSHAGDGIRKHRRTDHASDPGTAGPAAP